MSGYGLASTADPRRNERFHMFPQERLKNMAILSGGIGALSGFYWGVKSMSLRYLTENSHRLPTTVGGWYFYHKKKNYVMFISGFKQAVFQGTKTSILVSSFFGLEYAIDRYVRGGTIDLFNTVGAAVISGGALGIFNGLSKFQTLKYMRQGLFLGLSIGFSQDLLRWIRGGHVWYLDEMGIVNPRITDDKHEAT